MDNENLIDQVNKLLQQGKSKTEIVNSLLQRGYEESSIEEAFSKAQKLGGISATEVSLFKQLIRTIFSGGLVAILASYWPSMFPSLKLALAIFCMLTLYSIGGFLSIKRKEERISEALFLLGNLVFGGALFLAGQVVHVKVNLFWALYFWIFGVLAFAVLVRVFVLIYLALLINLGAIIYHLVFDLESVFYLAPKPGISTTLPLIAGLVFIILGYAMKTPKDST
jgi:uncharacterized membrane protein